MHLQTQDTRKQLQVSQPKDIPIAHSRRQLLQGKGVAGEGQAQVGVRVEITVILAREAVLATRAH